MDERMQHVLCAVVQEYVTRHQPVSSGFLARYFSQVWSPATMRNDLSRLEHGGFVKKFYCSSGSVPTNKAYQYLVEHILDLEREARQELRHDVFDTLDDVVQFLSSRTHGLSILIDNDMHMVSDGIEDLFSQPDFSTRDEYRLLAKMIDDIRDNRALLFRDFFSCEPSIHVGEWECGLARNHLVSSFIGSARTADGRNTVSMLVGPVRMEYQKNWDAFCQARTVLMKSTPRVS